MREVEFINGNTNEVISKNTLESYEIDNSSIFDDKDIELLKDDIENLKSVLKKIMSGDCKTEYNINSCSEIKIDWNIRRDETNNDIYIFNMIDKMGKIGNVFSLDSSQIKEYYNKLDSFSNMIDCNIEFYKNILKGEI